MQCPKCITGLKVTDRQGVEIDYCPTCRGVWLDRGELDKVIERSTHHRRPGHYDGGDDDDEGFLPAAGKRGAQRRGRGSWLSEMFDFGD